MGWGFKLVYCFNSIRHLKYATTEKAFLSTQSRTSYMKLSSPAKRATMHKTCPAKGVRHYFITANAHWSEHGGCVPHVFRCMRFATVATTYLVILAELIVCPRHDGGPLLLAVQKRNTKESQRRWENEAGRTGNTVSPATLLYSGLLETLCKLSQPAAQYTGRSICMPNDPYVTLMYIYEDAVCCQRAVRKRPDSREQKVRTWFFTRQRLRAQRRPRQRSVCQRVSHSLKKIIKKKKEGKRNDNENLKNRSCSSTWDLSAD